MDQQLLLPLVSNQSLSKSDSLALVQIFLNVSLACIAHVRELIPWTSSCFRVRYMGQINPGMGVGTGDLYSAFQDLDSDGTSHGQEIRILVRGGHQRADQILDMLVETRPLHGNTVLIEYRRKGFSKHWNAAICTHFKFSSQTRKILMPCCQWKLTLSGLHTTKKALSTVFN